MLLSTFSGSLYRRSIGNLAHIDRIMMLNSSRQITRVVSSSTSGIPRIGMGCTGMIATNNDNSMSKNYYDSLTKQQCYQHQHQMIRCHHPSPLMDPKDSRGWKAAVAEAKIPKTRMMQEIKEHLEKGLPGSSMIEDKTIPTFSRGELPHYAGINTFLKAPYCEDVKNVGLYDVAVVGVPFDGGCTYRPGTRFGPQGIRRISALYTPYNYERHIDLREEMTLCDVGDVFTIPANIEKTFAQVSNAVAHIFSSGAMPIILGGDHSIGFPTVRGIAACTTKNIGIIHVDRHADIQEKDLDERMHTTPYFHATNLRMYLIYFCRLMIFVLILFC